ncbi:MAG TPA: TlpA disulfide reductase family protein [Polyangia bacterium]|nr:TlpA disulfide reductase family protein [Polyangia bacterium]
MKGARWAGWALFGGLALLLALNLVWIARSWAPLTTVATPRGSAAPDVSFALLDGGATRVSDGRGRAQVLAFWATWCGPCKTELPGLDRLYARYGDRARFLAVSVDGADQGELVRAFVRATGLRMPVALDSGAGSQAYHVDTIPQLVIVDGEGRVSEVFSGVHGEGEVARAIERALERRGG